MSPVLALSHSKKSTNNFVVPPFSTTTASILTGAFTHATERRFGALLPPPHGQFGAKTKAYFTKHLPDTKVNYICKEDVFASVSFVTGAGLKQKLGTLYGSAAAVLEYRCCGSH